MRTTRKNHGKPINNLPKTPELDLIIYHWSPTKNRNKINHYGLRPGEKSLQGDWRPPYICFSDDPMLAWILSGGLWPTIKSWDLWYCHVPSSDSFNHMELCLDNYRDGSGYYVKEYRIYQRVYKRDLHYVATRTT